MQTIGEIANKHTYKNKKGEEKQTDISVIPNNIYMAFMLGKKHLVFIDSFQFMSSSLDKLVENIKKCGSVKLVNLVSVLKDRSIIRVYYTT